jgi:superfamily II DNA or RNA helicase
VPNTTLKRQLTDSFLQYFGSLNNITIENIDSPKLKNAKDYDCLIIDECHHSAAKTYRSLNKHSWNKIYYRFAFTATPFRSREEEQLLYESVAGQVIYQVSYHTAVKQGYICPVEAYYYEIPKTKIQSNSWPQVYSTLVVNNSVRNRIISELLSSLNHNKVSTLCLVKEIKHGETLSEYCKLQFANGINEDSKDIIHFFNQGKLTATNGVVGEGVDTKPAEFIVIAGLGKSKNQFLQQVGRGLRKYPGKESCKVIIFYDPSHKWTKEHYKAQCKYLLDEYNIIPVKLDLPNT